MLLPCMSNLCFPWATSASLVPYPDRAQSCTWRPFLPSPRSPGSWRWRVGQLLSLPEASAACGDQGCYGTDGKNSCAYSQLGWAPTSFLELSPAGRWILASEPGLEPSLSSGSSRQQEDFQVVAAGTGWGQICCWSTLPFVTWKGSVAAALGRIL